ncbi:MAG: threonine--tRNA ligase [Candidatus Magasanikbacteria bacterium]|nr:threonine--tRNA ligase [Candidatus Magasanikbacteria bacterium]
MDQEQLQQARHSCAHLLAAAVRSIWPQALNAIGPAIESGFYQDFDMGDVTVSEADLPKIEEKMRELVKQWGPFQTMEVSVEQARKDFSYNKYKLELIEEFAEGGKKITENDPGNFLDLCKGGHSGDPQKELRHFKLLSLAGAYWRGSEKNKMLTRIYGTAWPTKDELMKHLNMIEEAKKRDHRKLGKEMGLFVFSDLVGSGMPLFTPKGALVRSQIVQYSRDLNTKIGFGEVHTPNINKGELFKISGHYDKYKDDMLMVKTHYSDEEYFLKPMNCPQHTQIYASSMRSFRDLPIRYSDFANLYRDEQPGELSGLTRLRSFCQDDGHCFCREDQIAEEFSNVLGVIKEALATYGLNYWIRLSLSDQKQPEKYLGDRDTWQKAEATLRELLKKNKVEHKEAIGEAAFYGPKMDIIAKDSLGREWQISTIQLDLNMPARFGLKYIDSDGKEKTPVMIHRALVGSPERFMGILIEHFAGAFPVWLAPVQVALLPVSEKHVAGAQKIAAEFRAAGIRVETDTADETVGKKVRNAAKQKVPYIVVMGDRELEGGEWAVRVRGVEEQLPIQKLDFIARVQDEIKKRR